MTSATSESGAPTLVEALRGKRVGVVLSAGYFGFFAHAGFVGALERAGVVPAAWSGSSAGALVAALGAGGMRAADMATKMSAVARADFWDPAPVRHAVLGLLGRGVTGLLDGGRFRALLERTLPVSRIEDSVAPLVIVTSDITRATPRVFDRGSVAHAVHASCAYPGLFRTVEDDGQLWDGGIIDKAPITALSDRVPLDAIVVHYLVSATRAAPSRRHGYVGGIAQGFAAVRHEHYVLQARLSEASGVPVYELSPRTVELGPSRLHLGPRALQEAREQADRALGGPASDSRRFPRSS
jgi:NTE family protein